MDTQTVIAICAVMSVVIGVVDLVTRDKWSSLERNKPGAYQSQPGLELKRCRPALRGTVLAS